ncbi:hypothetical protein [Methylobacterium sp. PvR107]|uniref:hypothetical protein n=1 Tax=Methylobacterium sp. PvR107 TaxID=2806597 RepID=UPI001AE73151|nr:hypothetical protein [Methylobacterium sp. PvR107]MBP1179497.1 hypothetical protein [Methylobacterium sp. PvR107]
MHIVAANYADTLRRSGSRNTAESAVLDTVRHELRCVFGDADDDLPADLTALARRLDRPDTGQSVSA